jgi:ArsR family transcriptional regulator, arsenate/arsenite/antimonite-responsive transcriptional repressor
LKPKAHSERTARYADMFAALGAEPRLRILRLLLSTHPEGMVVGTISQELEIPASTLSHHLDKLKNEELVNVRRDGTFLWYRVNCDSLEELFGFLYTECCMRNQAVEPHKIVCVASRRPND